MKPTKHEIKKNPHSNVWLVNLQIGNKLLGVTVVPTY